MICYHFLSPCVGLCAEQVLLRGNRDAASPLVRLPIAVLRIIYDWLRADWDAIVAGPGDVPESLVNAASVGFVNFPPPQAINVNMMPIIIGSLASVPVELRAYAPLLAVLTSSF